MEFEKSIPFKNWTTETFMGQMGHETTIDEDQQRVIKYNTYEFKPGATYNVPASQAQVFARQLAVRELHRLGTTRSEMLSDPDMKEYMGKCFPGTKPNEVSPVNTFERIDEVKDEPAKESEGVKDANTATEREPEEGEESTDDEKNNAGVPKFKSSGRPSKVKTKDAEYV